VEYRDLGRTGLRVSVLAYGTAPLGDMFGVTDEAQGTRAVREAIDAGINLFDSSPYYGGGLAERRLGTALRGHRHEVLVAAKAGRYGLADFDFSPARVRSSVEQSLQLLQTDHVDILLLHDIEFVPLGPVLSDTFEELVRLRDEGKCRAIGMSGYPVAMLRRVILETDVDIVLSYSHATLLDGCLETSLLPLARDRGVGVINASAVALGLLTSSGSRIEIEHPATEPIRAAAIRARQVAEQRGVDISFLANQYAVQRSGCATTIVGTTDPHHLRQAVAAATTPIDAELLKAVLEAVDDVRGQCWTSGLPENDALLDESVRVAGSPPTA
jgi:L-galactose dehydrogenase